MKFFSKVNNYRIVLKPQIPGNPYLQIPPTPGISVKFHNGVVELDDKRDAETIKLLKENGKFNIDFFAEESDPFEKVRRDSEPIHDVADMENGRLRRSASAGPGERGSEIELLRSLAKEMALEMLKEAGIELPNREPVPVSVDVDEPTDHALSEEFPNGVEESDVLDSKRVSIPKEIKTPEVEEDDGENPLEKLADDSEKGSPEEKSDSGSKSRGKR